MLSIGKIALGQHRYYEQQVAGGRDDYYAGRGEAPGEWVGRGARALGIRGRVSAEQFSALLAGLDPRDAKVRLRSSEHDPKVAALDLTFSAPKSVSVLAAIAPDDITTQLIVAHEQALRAALAYLEDSAVQVRRGHEGSEVEPGEGLIAAAYRHRMSRALDPQLHTHVVAANMSRGADGRYSALHGTPLYRAAKTAGYLYQSHLRALITERLGFLWGPVHKGAADLALVPEAVLGVFSKRRQEMQRAAQEGGIGLDTKAGAQATALVTRDRKQYGIDTHTWRDGVRARAAELGLGQRELRHLLGRGRVQPHQQQPVHGDALAEHLAGPEGLTANANTFDERAVLQHFAAHSRSGAPVEEIRAHAERFAQRADVIRTHRGEMTTAELVACERALITAALGRAREGTTIEPYLIRREISAAPLPLTAKQAGAIDAAINSGDGVSVIEALAGTGKTLTAGVLAAIYRRAGHEVLGVAPTARAARELAEQARVPARTLHRLLLDVEQLGEELPRRSVVILDEAGMAPTRSSAALLALAARARAKVIAIGDPGQLASVQAGGWLRAVGLGLGAQRLTEVMRQRDFHERRALVALHQREPHRYLQWAQRAGRIETFERPVAAHERALGEWQRAAQEVGSTQAVMIVRDNETRDSLNTAARELWRALGLLGKQRTYGHLPLAEGERVICRRNDARIEVDNGMRGTVRLLEDDGIVIETHGGLVRELPAPYVAEYLEHAYALTCHGMQGATVERVIVLASPRDLTAGWSYTALSRARGATRLLICDEHVAERSDFAPGEQTRASGANLLMHVARHMRERDDEDLAVDQLPTGPGEIERAIAGPNSGSPKDVHARRALARIEDLDARALTLTTQHGRLELRLGGSEQVDRCRGDYDAVRRGHLQRALHDCERLLDEVLNERRRLVEQAGDLAQRPLERAGIEREIAQVAHGHSKGRDERAECELPGRGLW